MYRNLALGRAGPLVPWSTWPSDHGVSVHLYTPAVSSSLSSLTFPPVLCSIHHPVSVALALGHQSGGASGGPGGPNSGAAGGIGFSLQLGGGDGGGGGSGRPPQDVTAKLTAGLNLLAAPLRLTLRRAPSAPRAVTDLSGAALHAG